MMLNIKELNLLGAHLAEYEFPIYELKNGQLTTKLD